MNVTELAGAPLVTTTVGNAPEPVTDKLVTLVPVVALVKVTVVLVDTAPEAKPLRVPLKVPLAGPVPPVPA